MGGKIYFSAFLSESKVSQRTNNFSKKTCFEQMQSFLGEHNSSGRECKRFVSEKRFVGEQNS